MTKIDDALKDLTEQADKLGDVEYHLICKINSKKHDFRFKSVLPIQPSAFKKTLIGIPNEIWDDITLTLAQNQPQTLENDSVACSWVYPGVCAKNALTILYGPSRASQSVVTEQISKDIRAFGAKLLAVPFDMPSVDRFGPTLMAFDLAPLINASTPFDVILWPNAGNHNQFSVGELDAYMGQLKQYATQANAGVVVTFEASRLRPDDALTAFIGADILIREKKLNIKVLKEIQPPALLAA